MIIPKITIIFKLQGGGATFSRGGGGSGWGSNCLFLTRHIELAIFKGV